VSPHLNLLPPTASYQVINGQPDPPNAHRAGMRLRRHATPIHDIPDEEERENTCAHSNSTHAHTSRLLSAAVTPVPSRFPGQYTTGLIDNSSFEDTKLEDFLRILSGFLQGSTLKG
jgi:hypothetical protein